MAGALEQVARDIDALSGVQDHRLRDEQEKVWNSFQVALKSTQGDAGTPQFVPEDCMHKVLSFLVAWYRAKKTMRNHTTEKVNMLLQYSAWVAIVECHNDLMIGLVEMPKLNQTLKERLEEKLNGDVQDADAHLKDTVENCDGDDLKHQLVFGVRRMEEFGWKYPPADCRHNLSDSAAEGFNCVQKAVGRLEISTQTLPPSEASCLVEKVTAEVCQSYHGILSFLVSTYKERPIKRDQVYFVLRHMYILVPAFRAAVEAEPPFFWDGAGDEVMAGQLQSEPEAEDSIHMEEIDIPMLKWMWGDAGLCLHRISRLNKMRWSTYRSPPMLAADLEEWVAGFVEYRSNRPVELRAKGSGTYRNFSNYKEAIKWLRDDGALR
jgi:hypothetical protein